MAPPYKIAEFDIMFGSGISSLGCLLDAAEAVGVVAKRGSWYYYGEDKLAQGRDKTLAELAERSDVAKCGVHSCSSCLAFMCCCLTLGHTMRVRLIKGYAVSSMCLLHSGPGDKLAVGRALGNNSLSNRGAMALGHLLRGVQWHVGHPSVLCGLHDARKGFIEGYCVAMHREIEAKTRQKLTGEVDINEVYAAAAAKEPEEDINVEEDIDEFDLSEEVPESAA